MGIFDFRPTTFQNDEIFQKVGNVLAFFAGRISDPYITKISKLIYILDELSIKEIGMPVTGLEYKVAKMGPLAIDVWSSLRYPDEHFSGFISTSAGASWAKILPKSNYKFNDELFTEFEIELLEKVVHEFGGMSKEQLVDYTHSDGSPWSYTKEKHNINFAGDDPNVTNFIVDFTPLLDSEIKKQNFNSFRENLSF